MRHYLCLGLQHVVNVETRHALREFGLEAIIHHILTCRALHGRMEALVRAQISQDWPRLCIVCEHEGPALALEAATAVVAHVRVLANQLFDLGRLRHVIVVTFIASEFDHRVVQRRQN